ncbi:hypothetical protein CAPTEDRAFT_189456 [Capitella teleta]|uniref:Uncharacterized protein n=1 Tax=Capitella teleta TaxID=283909 RepID=R7V9A6_CAPTE|nr:hypothetical protein CAPTEDRAFT_189456 [Capitella teleta]|eukprot:ELU12315.1 hypothetical protein CAPTEDRAFT_189456 [Capitella teleta]
MNECTRMFEFSDTRNDEMLTKHNYIVTSDSFALSLPTLSSYLKEGVVAAMYIQQVGQGQQPQYVMQPQGVVNQGYAGQTHVVSQNPVQVAPAGMMQVQQPQYVMQTQRAVNQGYTGQAPQAGQQQQPQVIMVSAVLRGARGDHPAATESNITSYPSKQSMSIGILHVIVGVLCIGFGIGAIVVDAWGATIAHGIWGGVFFIITGAFAIVASKRKDYCNISTHIALAIVSMIAALIGMTMCIIGCVEDSYYNYWYNRKEEWLAMNGVLSCLFIIEFALTIWSAVICRVLCGASGDCSTDCGCYGGTPQYADPGTQVQYVANATQQLQFPVSTISAASPQTESEGTAAAQQTQVAETPDEEQPPKYQDQL